MRSYRSRVLILTASIGTGHLRAGQALSQVLQARLSREEVILQDHLALLHPRIPSLWSAFYLGSLKYFSPFYRKIYSFGIQGDKPSPFWKGYCLLVCRPLKRYLRRIQPDIILSTYAPLAGVLQELREESRSFPPIVIVNTDFGIGPLRHWPHLDLYTVACKENAQELLEGGIPPERIAVTGIPIHPDFAKPYSPHRYSSLAKGTMGARVLIGGGGAGVGPILEVLRCFQREAFPGEVIVLAGRNRKLAGQVQQVAQSCYRPQVKVLAYSNHLRELYSKAHLLISKPGGLTIAEAWAQGLPLIPLTPIPGLEEENLLYLRHSGLYLPIPSPQSAVRLTQDLLQSPQKLEELSERVHRLSRPYSTDEVVHTLLQLMDQELRPVVIRPAGD